jgi:tetratricopeptide (TPR) repeat protein
VNTVKPNLAAQTSDEADNDGTRYVPAMSDTVDLVERSGDLAPIEAALGAAEAGDGSLALVHGPAGIGKTALLGAATDLARSGGLAVFSATGTELEQEFPFGVVRQLYGRAYRESAGANGGHAVSAVFAPGPAADSSDVSFQVLDGLYWLVADTAEEKPLLLALDDAQWSDEPSLRHLLYLCRRLEGLAVAVVMAKRSGEGSGSSALEDLRELAAAEVHLSPLSHEGATALIEQALGEPPSAAFVSDALRQTGGYPLYLGELLRVAGERGITPDDNSAPELESIDADGLARHVWRRIESLGADAGAVVGSVAVLGEEAEPGRIGRLADLSAARVAEAVEGLAACGVLEPGEPPRFTHPIVRGAIEARLPAATLDSWHRKAARLLDREGADVRAVTAHLMRCNPQREAWAVERLREFAAMVLRQGAPESAALALRRALEEDSPRDVRIAVLGELARAEDAAGSARAALDRLDDAVRLADDDEMRAEIAISRAKILSSIGCFDEAQATLDTALENLHELPPSLEQRIDAELITYALVSTGARDRGLERLARYEGRVPEGAAAQAVLTAMAVASFYTWQPTSEAAALAERALRAGGLADGDLSAQVWISAVWMLIFSDRIDLAYEYASRELPRVRREGHVREIGAVETTLAYIAWRRGDIPEAVSRGEAAVAVNETTTHKSLSNGTLAGALLDAGELAAVADTLEATPPRQWAASAFGSTALLFARARLRLEEGRRAAGEADHGEMRHRAEAIAPGIRAPDDAWRIMAVTLAYRRGDLDRARGLAEQALDWARKFGDAGYLGQALRAAAPLSGPGRELELLREAVELLESSSHRLEYAWALIDLGATLRRRGERAAAREPLSEGLEIAHRCGAGIAVSQALEELRASGARPRRAVREGPEALTPSEARVAVLAAKGRSNREIAQELYVTLKTVENALGKAYAKLGISGRGARQALPEALGALHEGS